MVLAWRRRATTAVSSKAGHTRAVRNWRVCANFVKRRDRARHLRRSGCAGLGAAPPDGMTQFETRLLFSFGEDRISRSLSLFEKRMRTESTDDATKRFEPSRVHVVSLLSKSLDSRLLLCGWRVATAAQARCVYVELTSALLDCTGAVIFIADAPVCRQLLMSVGPFCNCQDEGRAHQWSCRTAPVPAAD